MDETKLSGEFFWTFQLIFSPSPNLGVEALIFTFVDVLGRFEMFLVKSYSRTFSMVE